jgi:orotate phosphoribosyltransferase
VDSSLRTAFIKYVKFTEALQDTPDLTIFIKKAIDNLDKHINLFNYDLVLFPKLRSRECQYMLLYIYRFNQPRLYNYEDVLANPMDEKLYATIRKQNVLVIDDVTTSGSTLNEILRSLRIVNDDNNITIFSLIGRKDLMADSL